jgi:putative membrane protein
MSALFRQHTFDEKIYGEVGRSSMKLRDYLATDRTKLSNQNTFLAYIRTSLTLFVVGVSFTKFFDSPIIETIGWAFIPIGFGTLVVGLLRYNRLRKALAGIKPPNGDGETGSGKT